MCGPQTQRERCMRLMPCLDDDDYDLSSTSMSRECCGVVHIFIWLWERDILDIFRFSRGKKIKREKIV